MQDLDRSILATLAYYGAFGWPLTLMEIAERCIPASRLGGRGAVCSSAHILERLDRLVVMGMVMQESGLYALARTEAGFAVRRIEQEKIWAQKWRRMLRKARWLQGVPYVRGMYASGSLALGNMSAQSDWDVFIIAQSGRLYTARVGLLLVAWFLRALRTKHDRVTSDTFCFNHYVTTGHLKMRHQSLYVAHTLALLVPVFDPKKYLNRLWQANQWMGSFLPIPLDAVYVRRSVRYSPFLNLIRRIGEMVLWWAEAPLRTWQKRRIDRTPATYERGGRVIANDYELEFHPRSFEAIALARYNSALDHFGLGRWSEKDSGLTR